jgi:hypothetical protein
MALAGPVLLGSWAWYGLPRIVLNEKQAAAYACTEIDAADGEEELLPWACFCISIPPGIVLHPEHQGCSAQHIFVSCQDKLAAMYILYDWITVMPECRFTELSLRDMAATTLSSSAATSAHKMVARIILSTIADVTEYRPAGNHSGPTQRKRNARGAVETRNYQIARNIAIDCRPAVAQINKGIKAPTINAKNARGEIEVQTLVCGHRKTQRFGKGLSESKRICVLPYWRGPEDAPVIVRPHTIRKE